jgi:hypothetical protein
VNNPFYEMFSSEIYHNFQTACKQKTLLAAAGSELYPSTNWPPVNGGQNSILDWVFKLNLSPNERKKQQKIIFTRFSSWNSEKQGYLSWIFFKIKLHVWCLCYKATSIVSLWSYILCLVPTMLRWHACLDFW